MMDTYRTLDTSKTLMEFEKKELSINCKNKEIITRQESQDA